MIEERGVFRGRGTRDNPPFFGQEVGAAHPFGMHPFIFFSFEDG